MTCGATSTWLHTGVASTNAIKTRQGLGQARTKPMVHTTKKGEVHHSLFACHYAGTTGQVAIGSTTPRTNIVTHHGVMDVLHQGGGPIRVLRAVQKPCDHASSFQWNVVLESTV